MDKFYKDQHWQDYCVEGKRHPDVYVNDDFHQGDGSSFIAKLFPDGNTLPHAHSGEEVIVVLDGEAEVTMNGKCHVLEKGDSIRMLSGVIHEVRNATTGILYIQAAFFPGFALQKTTIHPSNEES